MEFLHTGGIPHGTKRVILRAYVFAYHKHFALFHVGSEKLISELDFYQFQPSLGGP